MSGTRGPWIDLNCDAGEGGDDAALFAVVTSVNIACGGHFGDESTMRAAVRLARDAGVAVGAHPSYPDREGFGRRRLELDPAALGASLRAQIESLRAIAAPEGVTLSHVKPHGALYNASAGDPELAGVVAAGSPSDLTLFGAASSAGLGAWRAAGRRAVAEAFADRRYERDARLRARSEPDALIDDPGEAASQAVSIALEGVATAVDGSRVALPAESICVHSDTPGAPGIVTAVREALEGAGVRVCAPAPSG